MKSSLNSVSTCLKVVDTRRLGIAYLTAKPLIYYSVCYLT